MSLVPDIGVLQESLAALPIATYEPGEMLLSAGSKTGLLLILKKGAVAVVKDGIEIARVTEPGAIFGELSALLDQPHTADVHALEATQFYVANADALLQQNPVALLYVAAVLAGRLDAANRTFIELKGQIQGGEPHSALEKTVGKMEGLLGTIGTTLSDAGQCAWVIGVL
jgi:CRP/FNR family transcriptional regulator, cyclic AMP receptor protein